MNNLPIRALLLAAGLGTRLRPITDTIPKCLVEIAGKPLIEHWMLQLESINCEKALVNTHYLADQVVRFTKEWKNHRMEVQTVYEKRLLGTAGTLMANRDFFKDSTCIMIHADNANNVNLHRFLDAHRSRPKNCLMTMLTFTSSNPSSCGIVEINARGIVEKFHEKKANPPGNKANGAVYLFEPELINWLENNHLKSEDFSTEVIPTLLGKIHTWHTNSVYIDIGTPKSLAKAQELLKPNLGDQR